MPKVLEWTTFLPKSDSDAPDAASSASHVFTTVFAVAAEATAEAAESDFGTNLAHLRTFGESS